MRIGIDFCRAPRAKAWMWVREGEVIIHAEPRMDAFPVAVYLTVQRASRIRQRRRMRCRSGT